MVLFLPMFGFDLGDGVNCVDTGGDGGGDGDGGESTGWDMM